MRPTSRSSAAMSSVECASRSMSSVTSPRRRTVPSAISTPSLAGISTCAPVVCGAHFPSLHPASQAGGGTSGLAAPPAAAAAAASFAAFTCGIASYVEETSWGKSAGVDAFGQPPRMPDDHFFAHAFESPSTTEKSGPTTPPSVHRPPSASPHHPQTRFERHRSHFFSELHGGSSHSAYRHDSHDPKLGPSDAPSMQRRALAHQPHTGLVMHSPHVRFESQMRGSSPGAATRLSSGFAVTV